MAIYQVMTLICTIAALFQRNRCRVTESVKKPSLPAATAKSAEHEFEQIYQENFEFVWRTVRALGVSPAQVDDAVQEVFIVVHRRFETYEPVASLRSWIYGIVRRVAKDFRRARKRRGIMLAVDDDSLGSDFRDPYIRSTQNEALTIILAFADTLNEEWRAVFVLSELEELSAPEVASVLNMNLNTVYSRQRSLKRQLATYIATHIGEERGVLYE